jgi:hypothetical protein
MANKDISRDFRRWNDPLSYYWRAVRSTMASQISIPETLQNGFWPSSRLSPAIEDEFMDDNSVREEYAEDIPFMGSRRNCLPPSFAKYFLALHFADGDLHPF